MGSNVLGRRSGTFTFLKLDVELSAAQITVAWKILIVGLPGNCDPNR